MVAASLSQKLDDGGAFPATGEGMACLAKAWGHASLALDNETSVKGGVVAVCRCDPIKKRSAYCYEVRRQESPDLCMRLSVQ